MMTSTSSPKPLWRKLLPPAFWLGVWQLGAFAIDLWLEGKGNELLLPYPASVLSALVTLGQTWEFWSTAFASLARVLGGMALGTALGLVLATLTSFFPIADDLLSPAIRVVRATPVASFILLVLLWVKKSWVAVVISALMVLPVVWGNVSRGIREVDPQLLEMARAYRFSRGKIARLIYLPSLQPYFLSAVTTAMGLAWKSGVAAEVLCLPSSSIGTEIFNTRFSLEIPHLFAWTVVVVVLSFALEGLLGWCIHRWSRRWPT